MENELQGYEGLSFLKMGKVEWIDSYSRYKSSWKWNRGPHIESRLTLEWGRALLKRGGLFVRNAYDFDSNATTEYWYIIKDSYNGIKDVPSKYRSRVRKSLDKYEFNIVSKTFAIDNCYETYKAAAENYRVKTKTLNKRQFDNFVMSLDDKYDIWVSIDKESGRVAGFAINHVIDDMCDYDKMKFHPFFLKPISPSYGLIYRMNEYYLINKALKYVSDGTRSITGHSEIQSFLIAKYHFRKAYCHVQMFYTWWLRIIVYLLFPFRSFFKNPSIRAMLNMEEIARKSR